MPTKDESWWVEETVLDEPADLSTLPEIRQHITHDPHDDELGLRALLEAHEAWASPWWGKEWPSTRRGTGGGRRGRAGLARAA